MLCFLKLGDFGLFPFLNLTQIEQNVAMWEIKYNTAFGTIESKKYSRWEYFVDHLNTNFNTFWESLTDQDKYLLKSFNHNPFPKSYCIFIIDLTF